MSAPGIDALIARHGADAICAALAPMLTAERIARIDRVLDARLASLVPVVEDAYDPHNAAAAVRTSEAIGLAELHAVMPGPDEASGFGGPRPGEHGQKLAVARGISRGCDQWIDLVRWHAPAPCVASLRARGFSIYGTLPGATLDVEALPVDRPVAVLFGNEHAGLSPAAVALCDGAVGLPIHGFTESYNLSVTVALAMTRLAQRRRASLGRPGDLPPEVRARLRARWFALKLKGAEQVLARLLGDPGPGVAAETRPGVAPAAPSGENA